MSERLLFVLLLQIVASLSFLVSTRMRFYGNLKSIKSIKDEVQMDENVPRHVAFIVDGNGRWALNQNQSRSYGHIAGANKTVEIIDSVFQFGVQYITLYLLSTENWRRPPDEISRIMLLLHEYIVKYAHYFEENKIELCVIGQKDKLPIITQQLVERIVMKKYYTEEKRRVLCLAISYGGRDDIVQACQELFKSSTYRHTIVTEELFDQFTSLRKHDIPDPDLIIRTSGERRLSNFLLWQSAYSELEFLPHLCKLSQSVK